MSFWFDYKIKRFYRNEFSRLWLMWEQTRSTVGAADDVRIDRIRQIHRSAYVMASRSADVRDVFGHDEDRQLETAMELSLLEPWSQQLLQMSAADVLGYEAPIDEQPLDDAPHDVQTGDADAATD